MVFVYLGGENLGRQLVFVYLGGENSKKNMVLGTSEAVFPAAPKAPRKNVFGTPLFQEDLP